MLKISKMTDYGTLVLAELAAHPGEPTAARDIARRTGLGTATVAKLLKALLHADLVSSQRGNQGGYQLARTPAEISAAAIIDAIEGPVALTACSHPDAHCDLATVCGVGSAWQTISAGIHEALAAISLDDMRHNRDIPAVIPLQLMPAGRRPVAQLPPSAKTGAHE
ncbi:MAG: SUF system Fe-S cluster assembly regulator [Pseudomonadota bacterium]